ncbi:MAG: helix-turn-helix transcriptional regulator [Actinomycetota bacterium]
MKDEKTFGQRLRETRIRAGLSQSDLEEISGIPKARLSRYENGHVAPSIQTLERLAKALAVSEASLLGDRRAILEQFFQVLYDRGVRIESGEQAAALANAVADMYFAMRSPNAQGLLPPDPDDAMVPSPLATLGDVLGGD